MKNHLTTAIDASLRAGKAILDIYAHDFEVEYKADASPLTEADKAAHEIITERLSATRMPVLSEESKEIAYGQRSDWVRFWLVDPLDGTKEFVKKNGEFTVNIALIESGRPVLGVVYAPVLERMYYGIQMEAVERGAWRSDDCFGRTGAEIMADAVRLPISRDLSDDALRVVASRSHCNEQTADFIDGLESAYGAVERVSSGSSLKLCMVADGSADVYPRIAPTMEWDTAAAQAVVEAAGGRVVRYDSSLPPRAYIHGDRNVDAEDGRSPGRAPPADVSSMNPLVYNKKNLLNPSFVVMAG